MTVIKMKTNAVPGEYQRPEAQSLEKHMFIGSDFLYMSQQ